MLPSLFICHGAPSLAIEDNEYTQFLHHLGRRFKPKGIVLFTAHWESEIPTISYRDDVYETIYDFQYVEELFKMTYPAKGSSTYASMLEELFNRQGIPTKRDDKRGLDHGSWVVLRLLYPDADIPVIQVSVNPFLSPKEQFKLGETLRALRSENILIVGSGGTSHNLSTLNWEQPSVEPERWTVEFDDWLIEHVQNWDLDSLFNYETLAPHAHLAVPRAEHLAPFFIAFGSGNENRKPKLLHRSYKYGTLSHIAFEFD